MKKPGLVLMIVMMIVGLFAGLSGAGDVADSGKAAVAAVEDATPVHLFVKTVPPGGKIRILTIKPKFYQGMVLKPGPYQLEVSKEGFRTATRWVTLQSGRDRHLVFRLKSAVPDAHEGAEKVTMTNSVGMMFVRIDPGTFVMGSPPEETGRHTDEKRHDVTLTRGFFMGATEVTQGQWTRVMGENPSVFHTCGNDCPVENVTWTECQEFIKRLNEKEKTNTYRLPTEAEWEYSCRAGTDTALYTGGLTVVAGNHGKELDGIAWYGGNSCAEYEGAVTCSEWPGRQKPCESCGILPVGQKKPNIWGLYDMIGNVWEWCSDWMEAYPNEAVTDPTGPSSGKYRVLRGASWENYAVACRSAARYDEDPGYKDSSIGFRVVKDL